MPRARERDRAFAMAEPPPNPLSAAMAHELNGNAVAPLFSAAPGAEPAAAIAGDATRSIHTAGARRGSACVLCN